MHPFSFDLRIPSVRTVAPLWQAKVRSNLAKVFLIRDRKAILPVIAVGELTSQGRVSIQGVKSLWGIASLSQDWAPGTLTGGA